MKTLRASSLFAVLPLGLLVGAGFAPPKEGVRVPPGGERAAADRAYRTDVAPLLSKYCAPCHGKEKPSAGVRTSVDDTAGIEGDADNWRKIARQIHERAMPPAGMPMPTQAERDTVEGFVGRTLAAFDARQSPRDPGRVLIHRLNRAEYDNTVRDLLGVTSGPARDFPADGGGGGGFDNNADTLFLPPVLLERYLDAAETVLAEAPRARLFFAVPGKGRDDRATARLLLSRHAARAFRRPLAPADLAALLALYDSARRRGAGHEAAVKTAMKAVLVSPRFLFRSEPAPAPGGPDTRLLDDYEIASRLSYFLWSSTPDDTLLALAARGRLKRPAVLAAQVRRLLTDPRARAFADNFAGQWLHVRDLYTVANPDPGKFPEFTPALRDAMYEEPIRFFESLVREDRSLLSLLDADYTFVNETLAKHYGIDGVQGESFRRVSLPDRRRGGVLTMAGVLTLTSYPQRTSPVLRGKWVLSELLGTPPPPPPPLVATLSANDAPEGGLSFRQRLEKHRSKPECASCHARMDPIGFGLENFDPIGRWRTQIAGQSVDASGTLVGGTAFTGPAALKAQLAGRKDDFVRNATGKLLAYAIGRGIEPADAPALRGIAAAGARDHYRLQSLIIGVVQSLPFRATRRG